MERRVVTFCFDVVCPYAYQASFKVADATRRGLAEVEWLPVLLGGLYKSTAAPQGKDGSASDVMSPAKRVVSSQDTLREARRNGAPIRWNSRHPIRTLRAMRLLCAAPQAARPALAAELYRAYWQLDMDVSDPDVLASIAAKQGLPASAVADVESERVKAALQANTDRAVAAGAFGVPTFLVRDGDGRERMFWGQDRWHFALHAAGVPRADCEPTRLVPRPPASSAPSSPSRPRPRTVHVYHDFGSPWSYIGSTAVEAAMAEVGATVTWVPILLGALFKAVGTHNTPMVTTSEAKRTYGMQDLGDWCAWRARRSMGEEALPLTWPANFPLRTVTPLRVSIVEPAVIPHVYKAAWVDDVNVGEDEALAAVLDAAGFDGAALIEAAKAPEVKEQLKANTARAVEMGACGVPTYQVDGEGPFIWGQDRLHVVQDMVCGWDADAFETATATARL